MVLSRVGQTWSVLERTACLIPAHLWTRKPQSQCRLTASVGFKVLGYRLAYEGSRGLGLIVPRRPPELQTELCTHASGGDVAVAALGRVEIGSPLLCTLSPHPHPPPTTTSPTTKASRHPGARRLSFWGADCLQGFLYPLTVPVVVCWHTRSFVPTPTSILRHARRCRLCPKQPQKVLGNTNSCARHTRAAPREAAAATTLPPGAEALNLKP